MKPVPVIVMVVEAVPFVGLRAVMVAVLHSKKVNANPGPLGNGGSGAEQPGMELVTPAQLLESTIEPTINRSYMNYHVRSVSHYLLSDMIYEK